MNMNEVLDYVANTEGVVSVHELSSEICDAILYQERNVTSDTGMDVDNDACEEVMKKPKRVCIIIDNDLFKEDRGSSCLVLMDNTGKIVGTNVPKCDMHLYENRDDVVWLSDDFVLFPDAKMDENERFVVPAAPYPGLEEVKAVFASPTTSSDILIKKEFNLDLEAKTSTVLLGFE